MSDLKPIGSEKLTGKSKIERIMEIARYKETTPNNSNETSSKQFSIPLSDGSDYEIVKEKLGYVIKKNISESVSDYLEPMKNRKYYSSYSQALKRLNLLAKELNRLNENEQGTELFGEQKKFVLKTPKPAPAAEVPPTEPPAVPEPALPPSPEATADMGPEEQSPTVDDVQMDAEVSTDGTDLDVEAGVEDSENEPTEEMVTFKAIQKLTGKLTQKIRDYDNQDGMTSEDIKYVINMVLSSLDLKNLSEEDKDDIMAKFEEAENREEGMGVEDGASEDITSDTEVEDIQSDMDVPVDQEMGEGHGMILNNVFKESKVDKVLSKYFEISKKEILEQKENKIIREKENQIKLDEKMKNIVKFTETVEQEIASRKFLEENFKFNLVGKTNKKNLVFENSEKQVKITPEGMVI